METFSACFSAIERRGIPVSSEYDKNESEIVDLIWFPTGGGKTEAYLGVAAYSIIMSRFQNGDDCGTEVIMRYTLRLLTAQQFERASCLILALEYMRNKGFFKTKVFKIPKRNFSGLWVGDTLTPNKIAKAKSLLGEMRNRREVNKFVIIECLCKTSLKKIDLQVILQLTQNLNSNVRNKMSFLR